MEWYMPLTIIPGIGLIILSTSNIMLTLNSEITELENMECENTPIIKDKLAQLKRVSISIVFQYIGILLLLFSGIASSLFTKVELISKTLLSCGVLSVSVSIIILLIYSMKAVTIRQRHLKL
jgi:hypothetical protein